MKVSRFAVQVAATKLADSVINGDNYVTAHYGWMHYASDVFDCVVNSRRAFNVGRRVMDSVHARFGMDFWAANGQNFQAHAD